MGLDSKVLSSSRVGWLVKSWWEGEVSWNPGVGRLSVRGWSWGSVEAHVIKNKG